MSVTLISTGSGARARQLTSKSTATRTPAPAALLLVTQLSTGVPEVDLFEREIAGRERDDLATGRFDGLQDGQTLGRVRGDYQGPPFALCERRARPPGRLRAFGIGVRKHHLHLGDASQPVP